MFIDTHAHLYSKSFDDDRMEMIKRAKENGVGQFYLPNIDSNSIAGMMKMEAEFPGECFPMMGLHPCSVKEDYEKELKIVEKWLHERDFCAIGEIGTDLYWDKTFFEQQKKAFIQQLEWAIDLKKPIVIHCRESMDETIELVRPYKGKISGVFHCFGGTSEQAKKIMDLEFFMGVGGVLTFKKANLDVIIKEIPLEFLVLETDAPYLAPAPYRGKRNESGYIKIIAEKMAEIFDVSLEKIEEQTTKNAKTLFKIKDKLV